MLKHPQDFPAAGMKVMNIDRRSTCECVNALLPTFSENLQFVSHTLASLNDSASLKVYKFLIVSFT